MKILIEENGLDNALYKIENYLESALNANNKNIKNKFISKAYGAVTAIDQMIVTEDDEVNETNDVTDKFTVKGEI